jgi:hypothetical protein
VAHRRQHCCCNHRLCHRGLDKMTANLSIDTDPQQQKAAPPLMLVVRSFFR